MMNMKTTKFFPVVLFLLFFACTTNEDKPSLGEVRDGVYTNEFFNLELVVPEGWTVGTREEVENFLEVGSETMKRLNDSLATVLDTNDFTDAILFIMNKYPDASINPNRSVGVPSSLIMSAEKIAANPDLSVPKDYLVNLKKEYQQMNQLKMRFEDDYDQVDIGSKRFFILKGVASLGLLEITQEYWCSIENDYALVMILTYTNPFDRIEMHSAIKNMSAN